MIAKFAAVVGFVGLSCGAMGLIAADVADHGAKQSVSAARATAGKKIEMGNGQVWSWVGTNADSRAVQVGITMTEAALEGLPQQGGHGCCDGPAWVVPLPADAAANTPFTHIVINWNPQGHEPAGIYTVPHFDFHFYTMDPAKRESIKDAAELVPGSDDPAMKAPPAEQLPPGYVQAPGVVGKMGSHWIDPTSPEFNGKPFTSTFIYGSYDGAVTFVEPMITHATLASKQNLDFQIPIPANPADGRFVPGAYHIGYDAETKLISVWMDAAKP